MANAAIKMWERQERDGWTSVAPLEGEMANYTAVLNPVASLIYDRLVKQNQSVTAVVDSLSRQFPHQPLEQIRIDVEHMALKLKEMGVYKMDNAQITALAVNEQLSRPGLHIMDESEIRNVSDTLRKCCSTDTREGILYSYDVLTSRRLDPYVIRTMHFHSHETMFVFNDANGRLVGLVSLRNPGDLMPVRNIGLIASFADTPEKRIVVAVEMLNAVEEFAKSLAAPTKLRLIKRESSSAIKDDLSDQFETWSDLTQVLSACGYRKEATLADEVASGINIIYFSKSLLTPIKKS